MAKERRKEMKYWKIYALGEKGWEHITNLYEEETIQDNIDNLYDLGYTNVIVIEHNSELNQDMPYVIEMDYERRRGR